MKMTYGQTVAARGPEIAAAEIDRLQRKIVAAQQVVDQNSKASAILFLDEHQWDQSSYAEHQKGWENYLEKVRYESACAIKFSIDIAIHKLPVDTLITKKRNERE